MKFYRIFSVFLVVFLIIAFSVSCKGKSAEQGSANVTAASNDSDTASGAALLSKIPKDSYGFLMFDSRHPGYEKLLASPWAESVVIPGSDLGEMGGAGSTTKQDLLIRIVNRLGLDPKNKESLRQVFSSAGVFVSPPAEQKEGKSANPLGVSPGFGAIFTSDKSFPFKDKLPVIKEELQKDGMELEELDVAAGSGFVAKQSKGRELVVASVNDYNIVLSNTALAQGILANLSASGGDGYPQVMDSETFKKAFSDTPPREQQFAFGYIDGPALFAVARAMQPANIRNQAVEKAAPFFKALGVTFTMQEAPQTDIRLLYHTTGEGAEVFSKLSSSPSGPILDAFTDTPLAFLSVDGQSLKTLKDRAKEMAPAEKKQMFDSFSFVDSVKRVAVIAKVAAPGTSLLPIPDLMIGLQTSASDQAAAQIQQFVVSSMSSSGMVSGTGQWLSKEVEGTTVKTLPGSLGLGLSLAAKGDLLLLSSSEPMLVSTLGNISKQGAKGFSATLSQRSKQTLVNSNTLGNMYINFEQAGTFLETMAGVLAMYAPQKPGGEDMFSPEKLAALKKMGSMVASVKLGDESIGITTFYQATN